MIQVASRPGHLLAAPCKLTQVAAHLVLSHEDCLGHRRLGTFGGHRTSHNLSLLSQRRRSLQSGILATRGRLLHCKSPASFDVPDKLSRHPSGCTRVLSVLFFSHIFCCAVSCSGTVLRPKVVLALIGAALSRLVFLLQPARQFARQVPRFVRHIKPGGPFGVVRPSYNRHALRYLLHRP